MARALDSSVTASLSRKAHYLEVLHEFALSQVNLNSLDEILWNVAKTAIAKLGFVDCVIYLISDDGSTLIQKAAHGPKNPVQQEILNPITIKVGDGIVGAVAQTGKSERISDTRKDSRYIVDDALRLSELAVPIIHDSRVIGVLDSEHPESDFFTEEHVQLFTTIASLASTRIDTALAMERLNSTIDRLSVTEKRLEMKAEELNQAKIEADRASVEKSKFLANLSHEIRTPITAILGYAELLTRAGKSVVERDEWGSQVRQNTDYLLGLVKDVLDISSIESGELRADIRNCNLRELIFDVVALMRPEIEEKDLQFHVDVDGNIPTWIMSDQLRLRQALVNLLSNAMKYTNEGEINLGVWSQKGVESEQFDLFFQVEDTGIGIEAEVSSDIFEPFVRGDHAERCIAGAGLGLAMARNFARMLGGDIELESELGRGSIFTLHIVCGTVDDSPGVGPQHFESDVTNVDNTMNVSAQLEGRVIHVVEDSSAIATMIRYLLEDAGAEVTHSANGNHGVSHVLAARDRDALPDLILMDMQMPIKDGYAATSELRQQGIDVPIVAMTAFAFMGDKEKCLAAGCDAYMSKPIDPAKFVQQISVYML